MTKEKFKENAVIFMYTDKVEITNVQANRSTIQMGIETDGC